MTTEMPIAPIRKVLTVEAPIERAFRVFCENMGSWWPADHHIGKSPLKDCVIEPKVKGRWYEVCEDGSECDWGHVLAWDPPRRLVLAWQLDREFAFDAALVTEVEIRFTALTPRRTQVDFEHRNLERFGEGAERIRGGMDEGWALILGKYVGATAAAG
jgi:uncharacterized protein YndB with AHSA1/START domain